MELEKKLPRALLVTRWSARTLGLALLLLAGALLVKDLAGFAHRGEWPPAPMLATMFFHFALLVGLGLGWRWELTGGLVVIAAGTGFIQCLFQCLGEDSNLLVRLVTALPGLLFILSGWLARRQRWAALLA